MKTAMIAVLGLICCACGSSNDAKEDYTPIDVLEVVTSIESNDANERRRACEQIMTDRKRLTEALLRTAKELVSGDAEAKKAAEIAINLLGILRSVEAMPFCVQNLTLRTRGDRASQPDSYNLPSYYALAPIGVPCIGPLIDSEKVSRDEEAARLSAGVINQLVGKEAGLLYLQARIDRETNRNAKSRLNALLRALKSNPNPRRLDLQLEKEPVLDDRRRQLGGDTPIQRPPRDWRLLIRKIRERERSADLVLLQWERELLVEELCFIVRDSVGDAKKNEIAKTAIELLGKIRAEGAVPFLVEHLTFKDSTAGKAASIQATYPCVKALSEIGSRHFEPILNKAEKSDDETVARCAAAALRGVFDKELAEVIVNVRIDNQQDVTKRQRLSRLKEQIKKGDTQ